MEDAAAAEGEAAAVDSAVVNYVSSPHLPAL